ncbi:MAG TPA: DUF547 domain-containing protein [Alphaproteobacteria bacterium]|nr:DUF547 domain-containing protein [Alphaproteobacteria bacterium]
MIIPGHNKAIRPIRAALVAILLLVPYTGPATAAFDALLAPKSRLWERWTAHDPHAASRIDHGAWDRILKRYLIRDEAGLNRFAYGRVSPQDRKELGAYIRRLVAAHVRRYARGEQLAYWINLYNALTVQVVLGRYPVASIRDIDISPGLFANGPWDKKLLAIEGTPISLNDIEHRILRPIWRDARIHYALNCASIGCPNLRRTAFTGKNAGRLLNAGARDYVNSPRGVLFDGTALVVSSIYIWFKGDFGGSDANVIAHLRRYAAPKLKGKLKGVTKIDRHAYDWRINEQK